MIRCILLMTVMAGLGWAYADESRRDAWLEKREILTREAERLRDAYKKLAPQMTEPAENLVVPLDTYENGALKTTVTAAKAQVFIKKGLIVAQGVVVRKFDEAGAEVSSIEAADCILDRETKSGWAKGPFRISNAKTTFTGEDAYFSSEEGYVTSFGKSKLVSTDLKMGGVL